MAEVIGQAVVEILADKTKFEEGMAGLKTSLAETGVAMTSVGKTLSIGLTAPLAGIATLAAKAAIDFETAFTGVAKTVDASSAELAQIEGQLRSLATVVPVSATELMRLAEAGGQLGIKTQDIASFAEMAAKMGEATNLSSEQAAAALAKLAAITGLPATEFEKLGSAIVELGNKTAATESQIVEMSLRIAGAGSQIGLTEAEITGFAAALSSVGIEAEAGGTAISQVMLRMREAVASGGEELRGFAQIAGMTAGEFAAKFRQEPAAAIAEFIAGLHNMEAQGQPTMAALSELGLSGIRVGDALRRLGGAQDLLTGSLATGREAYSANTALSEEFARRQETTAAQLGILRNRLTEAAATLGEAFAPAMTRLVDIGLTLTSKLIELAKWFGSLPEPVRTVTLALAALAAGIGPMLLLLGSLAKAADTVSKGYTVLTQGIGALKAAIAAASGVIQGIGTAITAMNPILLAVGAALALLAIAWARDWGGIREKTHVTIETVKTDVADLKESLSAAWTAISEAAKAAWEGIKAFLAGTWQAIGETARAALSALREAVASSWTAIREGTSAAWEGIKGLLSSAWQSIRETASQAFSAVRDTISSIWSSIVDRVSSAVSSIKGMIASISSAIESAKSAVSGLVERGKAAISGAAGRIPRLQAGGAITRPGYAMVGERGPELLAFPRGAEVSPLAARRPSVTLAQEIHVDASPADLQRYTERALRKIAAAWEVS